MLLNESRAVLPSLQGVALNRGGAFQAPPRWGELAIDPENLVHSSTAAVAGVTPSFAKELGEDSVVMERVSGILGSTNELEWT